MGCSREVLAFLIAYNPDSVLLLDSETLYEGLQEGQWRKVPIGQVMLSSLAVAVTSSPVIHANKSMDVQGAISIMPNLGADMPFLIDESRSAAGAIRLGDEFNETLLKLSRMSCLLYSVSCLLARVIDWCSSI